MVRYQHGNYTVLAQGVPVAVSCGLGLQVPSPGPEAWRLHILAQIASEAAAKYARCTAQDDWL